MTNKPNKPTVSIAGDYAILEALNAEFYYGYEETEGGDWCFVAKFDGKKIVIPSSKLGVRDEFDVATCLLVGIGWVLAKYQLTIVAN
jgi:hypothetical protein